MTDQFVHAHRDRGAILPLVLAVSIAISLIVVSIATYTATTLRYGQVSEARAGRVASAQGAMDDALEQLSLRSSLCATAAGGAGIDVPFPVDINGTSVVVTCRIVGGALPPADGWAIVITEEGAPADASKTFRFTLGGKPEINGPVYLTNPTRALFSQPTTIVEGDIWYPDAACAETVAGDTGLQFSRSPLTLSNLSFDPTTRGLYCLNRGWKQLFGENLAEAPEVATYTTDASFHNRAYSLDGSCRVFEPGLYTTLPLGNSNYFKSGTYIFDNLGYVELHGKTITMGNVVRQSYPAIDNTACDIARSKDADDGGATLYTRGNTRFESKANSGIEISGRRVGTATVAVHVLDSTLGYATPLFTADNGAKKEVAIQGLLWAPYNSLQFDTIPSQKAAVLRGGAVVAGFTGGVSAAASGFVIEVPTSASSTRLLLESVATDDRASNTVRVVADYRPSSGEVAVASRRILD